MQTCRTNRRTRTLVAGAVDVVPTTDSNTAMALIASAFSSSSLLNPTAPNTILESWHFAEDDRTCGADDSAQSAVFCKTGRQAQAQAVLVAAGLA